MKKPKPTIPRGAPEGTVWFGGPIDWFRITLSITSEHLVPEEVSRLLGREPDEAQQKDKPALRTDGKVRGIPKFGAWRLIMRRADTDEWDCGEAMMQLLGRLPSDVGL